MKTLFALTLLLGLGARGETRVWKLQKPSARAAFTVEAPLDAIHGASTGLSGTLTFSEEAWASGVGRIRIDLTGFTTGLSLRDPLLRMTDTNMIRHGSNVNPLYPLACPECEAKKKRQLGAHQRPLCRRDAPDDGLGSFDFPRDPE